MSIMGRNITDDFPWWLPWWKDCIMPVQAGRVVPNSRDIFHRMSRLAVGSSARIRTKSLYLISTCACRGSHGGCISIRPVVEISSGVTLCHATVRLCLVPGVTTAIIPMPWKVLFPSSVLELWSTLSAAYWTNWLLYDGMSVPWPSAAFWLNI